MSVPERFSPLVLARLAGIFGVIGIVTGAFDIGYVHGTLIVEGNPSATFHNILTHATLFRSGFAAHLLLLLCNIPSEIIAFLLFRRVNIVVAAVSASCGLIGTAIEGLDMLAAYVPLALAANANLLEAFTPAQLQQLSFASIQLQDAGLLISFVFYGLDELLGGYQVVRSGFMPRVIGVLLSIAGFCYLANGFMKFLAPSLDAWLNPYIAFASFPGEASFALWLAIAGINVAKWRAWGNGHADPILS